MSDTTATLPTPALIVDRPRLSANILRMQAVCDAHDVRLFPHAKTHKCIEVARMQLDAGAAGLTVAKLGEAEALLPSGVRRVFVAYPLVDPETQAPRVRALAQSLDELIVAATSPAQAQALGSVLAAAGCSLPVLMAVDTGLGREGVRDMAEVRALADVIRSHPKMHLMGLFTHEGHAYRSDDSPASVARASVTRLEEVRAAISGGDDGASLTLWPGCSVTAAESAALPGVHAIRPGAYVFGDLSLAQTNKRMAWDEVAAWIRATVVDRPAPGLALIDAGSKTFSSDKTAEGVSALARDGRDLAVTRLSEEHGFVTGSDVDALRIGERIDFIPAHICTLINLTDSLAVTDDAGVTIAERWAVAARGRVF